LYPVFEAILLKICLEPKLSSCIFVYIYKKIKDLKLLDSLGKEQYIKRA